MIWIIEAARPRAVRHYWTWVLYLLFITLLMTPMLLLLLLGSIVVGAWRGALNTVLEQWSELSETRRLVCRAATRAGWEKQRNA
jgi:hypothetical protein